MTAPFPVPPVPVDQQAPPARAAASGSKPLRSARGSLLLTTGTGCSPHDTSLRQDPCSWQRGYWAGYLGLSACPVPAGGVDSWSWISGYIEGKAAVFPPPKS